MCSQDLSQIFTAKLPTIMITIKLIKGCRQSLFQHPHIMNSNRSCPKKSVLIYIRPSFPISHILKRVLHFLFTNWTFTSPPKFKGYIFIVGDCIHGSKICQNCNISIGFICLCGETHFMYLPSKLSKS